MKIIFDNYDNQFQIGVCFTKHKHNADKISHYHIIIDLGYYFLEITFGKYPI